MSLFDLNQTCEIVLTQRRFIWNFCSTKLLCTCIEGLKSYKINQDIDVWRKLGWGIRKIQKQPPRSVPRKKCSENMQQIYKRTPMRKCDFNKAAKQFYWNHTLAWVFSCKFAAYFQSTFSYQHLWTAASVISPYWLHNSCTKLNKIWRN